MRMDKRPILLFDVMETLINEPFFVAVPDFFGMTVEELLEAVHPTSWIEFEEGVITEAEYFERFFRDGRAVDGPGLRECLATAYRWLDGMEELLAELHGSKYSIHAFSNYSSWYTLIDDSLGLSRYLKWTCVSCLTGVRKPDAQAYLGAAAKCEVQPAECLFVDDRPVNVDAAIAVGMDAILRLDVKQVRRELGLRGILKV
jgi:HAD superfamily hydrolase (TIGR01509 family)